MKFRKREKNKCKKHEGNYVMKMNFSYGILLSWVKADAIWICCSLLDGCWCSD